MRRGFTLVEVLTATLILGIVTALSVMTFQAVSKSWQGSCEYLDKLQRTDFALAQVTSALRSMYYPHDGSQDNRYGFTLIDNGDGEDPDDSDVIEWSKIGKAIVGNKSKAADTVHRVQLMVLEEGNSDYRDANGRAVPIKVTGLYARVCPDVALRPKEGDGDKEVDYSFGNDEMYQPLLISDGICGFNCRVLKEKGKGTEGGENDRREFEDEFDNPQSNAVPYKVELTFNLVGEDGRSYRRGAAPIVRIVRIPIHEQSLDGNAPPGQEQKQDSRGGARKNAGANRNTGGVRRGGK